MQTNNPIYSDKFGNIEKALQDRFLVLPFTKDMKTAHRDDQVDLIQDFINCHFENEKYGIVKKALCALNEVMAHGKRFVYRFPLNACVGGTVSGFYSDEDITNLRDCAVTNYSAQSMTYSPVNPYVYSQSGQEMMCLLPASELYLRTSQGLPTPKLQAKTQDFTYDENSDTLYWFRNKNLTERYRLANFEVAVEKIYTLVATNAQEEGITLSIRGKNHSVSFDMKLSKLTSLIQEMSAQYPQFRIFYDLARANSIFQQYISEVYELSDGTLPHEIVYKNAGWQRNFNGWHYYSGNDSDCLSDFRLAVVEHEPFALIDWVSRLLEIADLQIMLPLFLHAHLGYTLKLFEEAGYNEQYILALIGSSGSKKTSLARVLFSLFGDALINFTSTNRGIELDLMNRQDSSLIMDDLSSGRDKVLAMKFEQILRQLGDSTGRKRSINGGNDLDCVATRCAVVLTTETDIDALSKSKPVVVQQNINDGLFWAVDAMNGFAVADNLNGLIHFLTDSRLIYAHAVPYGDELSASAYFWYALI